MDCRERAEVGIVNERGSARLEPATVKQVTSVSRRVARGDDVLQKRDTRAVLPSPR